MPNRDGPGATPARGLASRVDHFLDRLELGFIGVAMAAATLLLFANVVLRYVFLAPISWAEEVSLYLMVWMVFVGASVVVRRGGHIVVDLLPLMLEPANRRRLALLASLAVLAVLAVFIYYAGLHTLRVRGSGQLTPVMQAPMWLTYLAMPVGGALVFVRTCQLSITVLREGPTASRVHD